MSDKAKEEEEADEEVAESVDEEEEAATSIRRPVLVCRNLILGEGRR